MNTITNEVKSQVITPELIKEIAKWDKGKVVNTKYGMKLLRTAEPTAELSKLWRTHKEELKKLGVNWGKDQYGQWELCWWTDYVPAKTELANNIDEEIEKYEQKLAEKELKLFPYQREGVKFLLSQKRSLLADEMGLGKTIQASVALGILISRLEEQEQFNVCIIIPASLRFVWVDEIKRWIVGDYNLAVIRKQEDITYLPNTVNIHIYSYELATKYINTIKSHKTHCLILDEAHKCKTIDSERTKAILGGLKGTSIKSDHVWFLTGTPLLNRPIEIFPLLNHIDNRLTGSYWGFAKRYCNAKFGRFGWDLSGASNLTELSQKISHIMLRRHKKEVLTELPDKTRQIVRIDSAGVSEVEEEFKAFRELDRTRQEQFFGGVMASEIAKIRERLALKKVPHVIEFIENIVETQKVVVFAHHHAVIDEIMNQLSCANIRAVAVDGRTKEEIKAKYIEQFQNDEGVRVFVGGIHACGVGITLTASSTVVFAELDWTPAILQQAEDRVHRINQKNAVNIYYLVFDRSLDAKFISLLIKKEAITAEVLSREI